MKQSEIIKELRKIVDSETIYCDLCDFIDELESE